MAEFYTLWLQMKIICSKWRNITFDQGTRKMDKAVSAAHQRAPIWPTVVTVLRAIFHTRSPSWGHWSSRACGQLRQLQDRGPAELWGWPGCLCPTRPSTTSLVSSGPPDHRPTKTWSFKAERKKDGPWLRLQRSADVITFTNNKTSCPPERVSFQV